MPDMFAATTQQLSQHIRAARDRGDRGAERQALEELRAAYTLLGNRQAGTLEEQNAYIIGRRLGTLPAVLQELGIDDLPAPDSNRPPPARDDDTAARMAEHFAHIGGGDDEHEGRFVVGHRPEDNMRDHGKLLAHAVIDSTDGKPVAWYSTRDLAETVAGTANRLREAG
ncbi:hypothetical protein ACIP9H_33540 [Streptomyces sp. NPDC088732]|uniref:hypothetical protein n=1 Tax=Streptomyces sp. NPDC088732 TaxID=3365879 RepID=UPI00382EC0A9